tara:strand:+ start:772 stop:1194 length:423 start_codon:yes stop_codon:yes gene_type:complete
VNPNFVEGWYLNIPDFCGIIGGEKMDLGNVVDKYVGGQVEVQNAGEGYMVRGEVERIAVEDNELRVRFAWLASAVGFPPLPTGWVKDDRLDYAAGLEIYTPSDIGEGRVALNSFITGETIVLFPKDGSKLDPSQVDGLDF